MKAEVLKLTNEGMCEARTENDLLVVFRLPVNQIVHLSDSLEFVDLKVDSDISVMNTTQSHRFVVRVEASNIHDLRLPGRHGSNRTPSAARLLGG